VIDLHTIKPLDAEAVLLSVAKTGCAVTAEEHMLNGGMGDSVMQVLARNRPVPVEMVGVNDVFGESGKPEELLRRYGLDVPDIIAAAVKAVSRKQ